MQWLDAVLTGKGVQQAEELGKFWDHAIQSDGVCAPTSFYTSPLRRCLQTAMVTWGNVKALPDPSPPVVVEALREIFGVHTCDKRGKASQMRLDHLDQ